MKNSIMSIRGHESVEREVKARRREEGRRVVSDVGSGPLVARNTTDLHTSPLDRRWLLATQDTSGV